MEILAQTWSCKFIMLSILGANLLGGCIFLLLAAYYYTCFYTSAINYMALKTGFTGFRDVSVMSLQSSFVCVHAVHCDQLLKWQ